MNLSGLDTLSIAAARREVIVADSARVVLIFGLNLPLSSPRISPVRRSDSTSEYAQPEILSASAKASAGSLSVTSSSM